MTKLLFAVSAAVLATSLTANSASAMTTLWTLNGFVDSVCLQGPPTCSALGGTLTGSFDFNPSASAFTNLNITSSFSTPSPGFPAHYNTSQVFDSNYLGLDISTTPVGIAYQQPNGSYIVYDEFWNLNLLFGPTLGPPGPGLTETTHPMSAVGLETLYQIVGTNENNLEYNILNQTAWNGYVDPSQCGPLGCGPSATPLPAAFPLFALGLGALGLLGWRGKRKTA
jgi:hypothetical protein